MARNAGRPGTRRMRLRTAVAVCAIALGSFGAQASAATGAAPSASSDRAARADTPWKLRTPMSETASREFWGVAATGAKDAWAVGRRTDGAAGPAPLIRHWNGTAWTDVPAATTGGKAAQLEKVAASAPDDAWAAGSLVDNDSTPIVLQHWDGKKWTKVDHAAPAEGALSFVGDIATFGTKAAWLTSFDWDPAGNTSEYRLERWTGSAWHKVSLPAAPGGGRAQPWDITGTGPDDVWVTADAVTGEVAVPLLYHWNGSRWTVREVPVPAEHPTGWVANRAVATGRNSVYVLGKTNDPQAPTATMAAHWNGSRWQSLAELPVDEANTAGADGAGRLWIAGWTPGNPHSVMARWTGTKWATEELPADVTGHSEMSTVLGIAGVPGTKGVFAAGTAGCASDPVQCGVLVSRDLG
ncbi:hypothetical protein [Streptomyces sp. ME19-01-6]|uniref:hypothetical protein n=1 Tax=Streptomyces sp. ME19-01-6 TaxID=3028686 RepID=UPI0029BB4624|nr:hypothetical protein [Streptomyces sp. ME19-01-6]MDX3224437.1 hypothetical protein [Streptomyces sp. ME19-01-6]